MAAKFAIILLILAALVAGWKWEDDAHAVGPSDFCLTHPTHWKCQPPPPPPPPTYLFQDEFNGVPGAVPDSTKWIVMNSCPPSSDFAYTCQIKENVFMDGQGRLVVRVSKGTHGRPYDGGWLATWSIGGGWPANTVLATVAPPVHIEVMAKPPAGPGIWPGFWPENPYEASASHLELDIMELRMFYPTVSTCHTHGVSNWGTEINTGVDLSLAFHRFWADYYTDHVVFGVDGLTCGQTTLPASFREGMQISNIVGQPGTWGGVGGPPADSYLPADLLVDYVRAWRL